MGPHERPRSLVAKSNPWVIEHEENRTPEEYESEVEEYLDACRERLPKPRRRSAWSCHRPRCSRFAI